MEMCVLGESQIVSRLPPASVAEAAACTALLDCARCFIVFLGWSRRICLVHPWLSLASLAPSGMSLGTPSH